MSILIPLILLGSHRTQGGVAVEENGVELVLENSGNKSISQDHLAS